MTETAHGASGTGGYVVPEVIDGAGRRYRVLQHNVDLAARLYPLLVDAARQHKTRSYKDLALLLDVHHRRVEHGLRIIQHWCANAASPPLPRLTALVVGTQSNKPGSGYIEGSGDLAADLDEVFRFDWPRTTPFGGGVANAQSAFEDDLARLGDELEADDFDGDEFEPDDAEDARETMLRNIQRRRGQQRFRRALLNAYERQCAISECQVEDVLEAAHIVPYCQGGPNRVENGVLLRADLHTLMDLDLLALAADDEGVLRVRLSNALLGSSYEEFDGIELAIPTSPSLQPSAAFISRRWKSPI